MSGCGPAGDATGQAGREESEGAERDVAGQLESA